VQGLETSSTVAAPLLAGAAITLAGVVIQQEDSLRHPGAVLALLILAAAFLLFAVQAGSWARRHYASPDEITQWWPDANEARLQLVRREQRHGAHRYRLWARRYTFLFNGGLLVLWCAVAVAAMPKPGVHEPGLRWVATAIAAAAAILELAWVVLATRRNADDPVSTWFHGR
jgi:hypothetical protein